MEDHQELSASALKAPSAGSQEIEHDQWDEGRSVRGLVSDIRAKVLLWTLYHAYLFWGIYWTWNSTARWCHNIKLLTVFTCLLYSMLCVAIAAAKLSGIVARSPDMRRRWKQLFWWWALAITLTLTAAKSWGNVNRLVSVCGLIILMTTAYLASKDRTKVDWSQVLSCTVLAYLLAYVFLLNDFRDQSCLADKMAAFGRLLNTGTNFVFGHLATGINMTQHLGDLAGPNTTNVEPVFTFSVLPAICCVNSMMKVLYYLGLVQVTLYYLEGFLSLTIGYSACEVLFAIFSFFFGPAECLVLLSPYLNMLTTSNMHCLINVAFSTITGTLLIAYSRSGVNARYLTAASVMSVPASMAYSKLIYPETEVQIATRDVLLHTYSEEKSLVEAALSGALIGLYIIACAVGNIVTYMSVSRFASAMFDWAVANLGFEHVTFQLAVLIGVPWDDTSTVGQLIATKLLFNEHVAYDQLKLYGGRILERSEMMATFALCDVSNLSTMGMVMGVLAVLCPTRMLMFTGIMLRVIFTSTGTSLLTACVAGSLHD